MGYECFSLNRGSGRRYSKKSLDELTNDFEGITFIEKRITQEQKITIITILNNESNLKSKILSWIYANPGFINVVDVEEMFFKFVEEFNKPEWAFDYNYSDDELYNPYYYIVVRLNYFLTKERRKIFKKLNSELRIYEQNTVEGEKLPAKHVSLNVVARKCQEDEEDIDDTLTGFLDLQNTLKTIEELENNYNFPFLDLFLVELDAFLSNKKVKLSGLSLKCNLEYRKISEMKDFLHNAGNKDVDLLRRLLSELVKVCNDRGIDIFSFSKLVDFKI